MFIIITITIQYIWDISKEVQFMKQEVRRVHTEI